MIKPLLPAALIAVPLLASAQWVQGGLFSTFNHFQACAFHTPDSGLFVYGADNPASGEGGIIRTDNGISGGGFYIWYEPFLNIEDIDVRVVNGFPYYLAAGHQQYNRSIILKQELAFGNIYQFDSVRTGLGQFYRAVRFRSDLVAFAAGGDGLGNGIIDMSVDTGATWSQVTVLPGQPVSRLDVVNDQLLFAATGGYRRTVNNGVLLPDSGAVYRSTDGGMTWTQVLADPANGFSDVSFADVNTGAATRNDGTILYTTDGGTTWTPATIQFGGPFILTAVEHRPDGTAFAAGYRTDGSEGFILISADGGITWDLNFSSATLNNSRRVYDLHFFNDVRGYASTHIRPHRTNGLITAVAERTDRELLLYPNPSSTTTRLQRQEADDALVEVFDAWGRLVGSHHMTSRSIDLVAPGAPGNYVVRVRSAAGVRTIRWTVL